MSRNVTDLEREALSLPPGERERLALAVWASLDRAAEFDPDGIDMALDRDSEIESGAVEAIDHEEFTRRTAAADEG